MEEEWTHFVDSKGSDKQKLISIAAPDSTKKSTKFFCQQALQKVIGGLLKKKIPIWLADISANNGLCWEIVHKNSSLPSKLHLLAN